MSEQAYAVVGYIRVSTSEQADSGAGLEAQRAAISAEAERRGWELVHVFEDAGASGKSLNGRSGLQRALEAVEAGRAEGLVVAKLDRLSRSLLDFAALMERARKRGWNLIALDLGVDTSTPAGEMMASVLATFAQFERRLIGQRTKDALAVKRAQGVRLGRPRTMSEETVERIRELKRLGMSRLGHRSRTERGRRPNRDGSRSLAFPRRRAGAVLGSFVMYAEHSMGCQSGRLDGGCPLADVPAYMGLRSGTAIPHALQASIRWIARSCRTRSRSFSRRGTVIVARRSCVASTQTCWPSTSRRTAHGKSPSKVPLTLGTMSIAPCLDRSK